MAYVLTVLPTSKIYPEGYLFLCPWDDLRSEDGGFVERPECPAYWSLDTSGCERLSPGEASAHGFPSFKWQRIVGFRSWDERVYAGLSQFHAGKGFDPYSQDVARHLGYPLYELSYRPSGARIEEVFPNPDLGNAATIVDEDPPHQQHVEEEEIHQDHRKIDKSVLDVLGPNTHMDRWRVNHNFRFVFFGALGIILALLYAYLCSL